MSKKRWVKSGNKCPICKNETELLVDDTYEYKERCKHCKVTIDFDEK